MSGTNIYPLGTMLPRVRPGSNISGNGGITSSLSTLNLLTAHAILTTPGQSYDALIVETVGAFVGSVVRMGLYNPDGRRPGTLIVDAGTVPADVGGVKTLLLAQPYRAESNVTFVAGVSQGVAAVNTRNFPEIQVISEVEGVSSTLWYTPNRGGVAGALPATFGGSIGGFTPMAISLRALD